MRLTLRAACWLHYWQQNNDAAAKAVEITGINTGQAWRILDAFGEPTPGADAERAA